MWKAAVAYRPRLMAVHGLTTGQHTSSLSGPSTSSWYPDTRSALRCLLTGHTLPGRAGCADDRSCLVRRNMAAICSTTAAAQYGLEILEQGIQDSQPNLTRFIVLSRYVAMLERLAVFIAPVPCNAAAASDWILPQLAMPRHAAGLQSNLRHPACLLCNQPLPQQAYLHTALLQGCLGSHTCRHATTQDQHRLLPPRRRGVRSAVQGAVRVCAARHRPGHHPVQAAAVFASEHAAQVWSARLPISVLRGHAHQPERGACSERLAAPTGLTEPKADWEDLRVSQQQSTASLNLMIFDCVVLAV